jgi:LemA protein
MSIAKVLLIVLIVLVAGAIIVGGCAIRGYNKAVSYDENVKQAWAQVENQLQRRFDLVPNLVETVKGYAKHEKELFENIAQARTQYFQAKSPGGKIEAAGRLDGLLSRLLVLRETYPELKANQNFMDLQAQLEGTENRIAVERKRYNDAVGILNRYVRSFLGRIYCSWASVDKAQFFEVEEKAKAVPKVDFSSPDAAATQGQ